jgi:hypothetical protein
VGTDGLRSDLFGGAEGVPWRFRGRTTWTVATCCSSRYRRTSMGTALLILILLALLLGGVGLFVEALRWLLIIALVLLLVGAVTGFVGRGRAQRPRGA